MRISDWSSDVCSSDLAGPDTAWKVVGLRSLLEMAQDSHASVISSLDEDMKRDEAALERGKAPAALGANAAPADKATVVIGSSYSPTKELIITRTGPFDHHTVEFARIHNITFTN